jgi:hypothetical protein
MRETRPRAMPLRVSIAAAGQDDLARLGLGDAQDGLEPPGLRHDRQRHSRRHPLPDLERELLHDACAPARTFIDATWSRWKRAIAPSRSTWRCCTASRPAIEERWRSSRFDSASTGWTPRARGPARGRARCARSGPSPQRLVRAGDPVGLAEFAPCRRQGTLLRPQRGFEVEFERHQLRLGRRQLLLGGERWMWTSGLASVSSSVSGPTAAPGRTSTCSTRPGSAW